MERRGEVSQMEKEREKEQSRAGQQQQQRRRIKMCGEVMAVMNSPWLIGGSQVGV